MNLSVMQNAVTLYNGVPTTTSLKVAEAFGKKHCNVIQSIEKLQVPDEWCKLNFEATSVEIGMPRGGTRLSKTYRITRDGFTLLAMGFTGARAMEFKVAYIEEFNRMESELNRSRTSLDLSALIRPLAALTEQLAKLTGAQFPQPEVAQLPAPEHDTPSPEEVDAYCRERGYELMGRKFCEYYNARDWRSGDGVPVSNWMRLCDHWHKNQQHWVGGKQKPEPGEKLTPMAQRRAGLAAWDMFKVAHLRKVARILLEEARGVGGIGQIGHKKDLIELLAARGISPSKARRALLSELNPRKGGVK